MDKDSSKKLILRIEEHDWGIKTMYSWNTKTWYIYDDLSIEFIVKNDENKTKKYSHSINETKLEQILSDLELAKSDNRVIYALDGKAWNFIQYENDNIVWKRELGYIYGIEPLENICHILNKMVRNDSDIFERNEMEENNMGLFNKNDKYDVDEEKNIPQAVYGPPEMFNNKYNIEPEDNTPQRVYGVLFDKYDVNESDNVPQDLYGPPNMFNENKYDIEPEENTPQKVYGVPSYINDKDMPTAAIYIRLKSGEERTHILITYDEKNILLDFVNYKRGPKKITEEELNSFLNRFNEIKNSWKDNYFGERNINWSVRLPVGSFVGKGDVPENWDSFIDLLKEYERLYNSK